MRLRELRGMGLTFANVRRIMLEMRAAGELERRDANLATMDVLGRLTRENPTAFADPMIDWDGLFEFIKKIVELIFWLLDHLPTGA